MPLNVFCLSFRAINRAVARHFLHFIGVLLCFAQTEADFVGLDIQI